MRASVNSEKCNISEGTTYEPNGFARNRVQSYYSSQYNCVSVWPLILMLFPRHLLFICMIFSSILFLIKFVHSKYERIGNKHGGGTRVLLSSRFWQILWEYFVKRVFCYLRSCGVFLARMTRPHRTLMNVSFTDVHERPAYLRLFFPAKTQTQILATRWR